jgi:hypothetical protein
MCHAACMGDIQNFGCKTWREYFEDIGTDGRIISEGILEEECADGVEQIHLAQDRNQ